MESEGLEEERRLFYVGLTRAMRKVTLVTAGARRRFGGMQMSLPSRFLDEIDPDLVERRAFVTEAAVRFVQRARSAGVSFGTRPARGDDYADATPSYENESQDPTTLRTGMRVRHPSWGEGIVETMEGRGENLKLTIRFRGGVRKKVLATYAKLEALG
jgi:DNA helicase-2/ATP-dependent DNA helicase PcrA